METFIQALIMAFREGLEAFMLIAIIMGFLDKTGNKKLKSSAWLGTLTGVLVSIIIGLVLISAPSFLWGADNTEELWASIASFLAVALVTTLIIWMIKHGDNIEGHIEEHASSNLSGSRIFLLAMFLVVREGAELAVFSFAGKYQLLSIFLGLMGAIILAVLISYSVVKIKLTTIFNFTLGYLILQAGFMMGYSLHEGLSASTNLGLLSENNPLNIKAFDLSNTVLNNEDGVVGIPLYVAAGWYSEPTWLQFIIQYLYTFFLFAFWFRTASKIANRATA